MLMEHLYLGFAHGRMVFTRRSDHLVLGDELLDHSRAGRRTALGILDDQLDLLAQNTAGCIDILHCPLEPQDQFRTLLVATG